MNGEMKFGFRERIDLVHPVIEVDPANRRTSEEIEVDAEWSIVSDDGFAEGGAGRDLHDFFAESFRMNLPASREKKLKTVSLETIPGDLGFDWKVTDTSIEIRGNTRRGVFYLEDQMKLREAPFLKKGTERRDPLFHPRMTHSGWGLDQFPDSHLSAIAHAGFDAILLYVKGVNKTTHGYLDFNDVIRRAGKYGLSVYFYSYINSFKHPSDPDAEEFFEKNYGSVFQACRGVRGLILVGESCQFPSRDPRVRPLDAVARGGSQIQADPRPGPGFFPADDYPQWLNAVKKAVHRHQPDTEIVFWTYNWGGLPAEERIPLIDKLPEGIILEATFEMFQTIQYENYLAKVPDYTITFPGPGDYFISEARAAHARRIPLYSITNTGGLTWDCGTVPYIPVPNQWFRRFRKMIQAKREWNLSGIMDSHHYGWFPNPVLECSRWCFRDPSVEPETILEKIAIRDFGKAAAPNVLEAWRLWSEAMNSYTPGFDDQSGPLRIGPSYPFIFQPILYPYAEQKLKIPYEEYAYRGKERSIVTEFYQPEHIPGHTFVGRRIPEEIRILEHVLALWDRGVEQMSQALKLVPEKKLREARYQAGVGIFFRNTLRTMSGIKRWWLLNKKLETEYSFPEAERILDELEKIAAEEMENVRETIPLVEYDSRLGWEPTMEYVTDKAHLEWKLERLAVFLKQTLPAYRKTIR